MKEKKIWEKIGRFAKSAGIQVVYAVLLMFYAFKRKETPFWAKNIIVGVLAYFLSPIDAIPDLTPFLGYTDDLGVLVVGLSAVAAYVNADVKEKAREKLHKWFGAYNDAELQTVDERVQSPSQLN